MNLALIVLIEYFYFFKFFHFGATGLAAVYLVGLAIKQEHEHVIRDVQTMIS